MITFLMRRTGGIGVTADRSGKKRAFHRQERAELMYACVIIPAARLKQKIRQSKGVRYTIYRVNADKVTTIYCAS